MPITPETLPDDPAALKRIIAAMAQDALTAQAEIARLKFQLARYRRAEFGRSSEKLARDIEQLEMALEALETDQAERLAMASPAVAAAVQTAAVAQKPARRHDVNSNQLFRWRRQLLPKAVVESGAMVPVEIAPEEGGRPRRTDREGVIEIAFGCGARVRLRGEVSSETLRQVIELLR